MSAIATVQKVLFGAGVFGLLILLLLRPVSGFASTMARMAGSSADALVIISLVVLIALCLTWLLLVRRFADDELWRSGRMVIPIVLMVIGHLGLVIVFVMLSGMESGRASGLVLLPPALWSILFYGLGTFVGMKRSSPTTPS